MHIHFVWMWRENEKKENKKKENEKKNMFSLLLFGSRENGRENEKKKK